MKKIFFALCALAIVLTACEKKPTPIDVDDIVEDGVYVTGEATGFDKIDGLLLMANGINEAKEQSLRDGMFEKYIVLQGGKEFSLVWVNGGKQTLYGASLAEFTPTDGDNPTTPILKGALVSGDSAPKMKVAKTGLYHIVLDLNKDNLLDEAMIIVAAANMGVRGGMNSWGFTELEATAPSNDGITYTLSGQELSAGGKFKFAYAGAWKITLGGSGDNWVKANTNLGQECKAGGADIENNGDAGEYKITLTFKLAAGDISNSWSYTMEFEKASALPTEMYMIGAGFGGWSWESEGVARLSKTPWKDGCFVITRFFKAGEGFKFSPAKDWGPSFAGMGTNSDNVAFDGDGNVVVPSDGLWTISINVPDNTLTLQPTEIMMIGDCVTGGWDAPAVAGAVDIVSGTATVIAQEAGNLRTYCKSAFDWWQHEFTPTAEGGIRYRGLWIPDEGASNYGEGANAELPGFAVAKGAKVTFNFNEGTTTVE